MSEFSGSISNWRFVFQKFLYRRRGFFSKENFNFPWRPPIRSKREQNWSMMYIILSASTQSTLFTFSAFCALPAKIHAQFWHMHNGSLKYSYYIYLLYLPCLLRGCLAGRLMLEVTGTLDGVWLAIFTLIIFSYELTK